MTITTHTPDIFDISWPIFAYQDSTDPDEAHRIIRRAHQQAPIALGPYGPEVLDYDLARTVLRDSRFVLPRGLSLAVQGITSGPVRDKVCQTITCVDAAQHHRLRRLVSRAFTPRAAERMRTARVDIINKLIDRHSARGGWTWFTTSPGSIRSPSSARWSAHRATTGNSSPAGPTTSARPSVCNVAAEKSAILRACGNSTPISTT